MSSFETQIDKIIVNSNARMLVVVRESITDVIEEAQKPVSQGGKMRVDTGFLRASGVAALNKVPQSGKKYRDRKTGENGVLSENKISEGSVMGESLNIALAKMKIGDTFYFGWTANYAKYREMYDGFLASSLQKWQTFVNKSVRKYRKSDFRSAGRGVTGR